MSESSNKSTNTTLIVILVLLVVAVIALAAFLILPGLGSSPEPGAPPPAGGEPPSGGSPSVQIVSVEVGTSVTIEATNFPPNEDLIVRIAKPGSEGKDGVQVGTTNSGASGSFSATYNIPAELNDESPLVIRLESPSGYFAFHSFNNQ